MTQINTLLDYIATLVEPSRYPNDFGHNGIQVDNGKTFIRSIAGAVDSGMSIIEKAVNLKTDMLIVHHGIFWGQSSGLVTGINGAKIRHLIHGGCSLYGCHLPLDGNLEVGNAAEILRLLGVSQFFPFAFEAGVSLGAMGELPLPMSIEEICLQLSGIEGYGPEIIFPFGKKTIQSIGVCTGAGGFAMEEARAKGIDLLISGEPKQYLYHHAKDMEQSALFIGHYASETFGVKALLRVIEKTFSIPTHWISEPTQV